MANSKPASFTHACTQWVFLRLLGLVYAIAFLSLLPQIEGLIGSQGILPGARFLNALAEYSSMPAAGISQPAGLNVQFLIHVPTIFWLNCSDSFIFFICCLGVMAAAGIMLSVATAPLLVVAWLCYLSLVNVGQDFLSFQWDSLLLETGFLAIFWADWEWLAAPWRRKPLLEPEPITFRAGLWLFRWLLFRLMFLSGAVKLLSGDVTWRNLSALNYHYLTQPLPTPLGWLAYQLPPWFQSISVAGVFFIELTVPFCFFMPRPYRYAAVILTASLQVLIMLTGNFTFFNLLTLSLCVLVLDDTVVKRWLPSFVRNRVAGEVVDETRAKPASHWRPVIRRVSVGCLALLVGLTSVFQLASEFFNSQNDAAALHEAMHPLLSLSESFHIVNTYGLFAVMTTTRPEIEVQGSMDGINWRSYVFRYKPGPLNEPPPIIEPFQPRLDWQMWFAALGTVQDNPWFLNFAYRLLQGSPSVLALIKTNPFPDRPPRYVRALLDDYGFTAFPELLRTGRWWTRRSAGVYLPPVSLSTFDR